MQSKISTLCILTLKAHISQVQYGCQELEDFLTLVSCESERLEGGTNAAVVSGVVSPPTGGAVALKIQKGDL